MKEYSLCWLFLVHFFQPKIRKRVDEIPCLPNVRDHCVNPEEITLLLLPTLSSEAWRNQSSRSPSDCFDLVASRKRLQSDHPTRRICYSGTRLSFRPETQKVRHRQERQLERSKNITAYPISIGSEERRQNGRTVSNEFIYGIGICVEERFLHIFSGNKIPIHFVVQSTYGSG